MTGAFDHGAPADIAWRQKPHVGTDLLRGVIIRIRGEIEVLGGEVRFNTALTGLHIRNGARPASRRQQALCPGNS